VFRTLKKQLKIFCLQKLFK